MTDQKSILDQQASDDDRNCNRNQQPEKEAHIKKSSGTENTVPSSSGLFDVFRIPALPPLRIGGNVEIPLEISIPQISAKDFSSTLSLSKVYSSKRQYSRAWGEDGLEKREQDGDLVLLGDDTEKEKRRCSNFWKKWKCCFYVLNKVTIVLMG